MKKRNLGFTLVEMVIVTVIIGLLAAMAIPAFEKVRSNSLVKLGDSGAKLDYEERIRYNELKKRPQYQKSSAPLVEKQVYSDNYKTIEISGHSYLMFKKNGAQEISVGGETYIIIPTTK